MSGMKTKIILSINPAAIAIALFCAVAVLAPTDTTNNHTAAASLRNVSYRSSLAHSNTATRNAVISAPNRLLDDTF